MVMLGFKFERLVCEKVLGIWSVSAEDSRPAAWAPLYRTNAGSHFDVDRIENRPLSVQKVVKTTSHMTELYEVAVPGRLAFVSML